MDGFDDLAAIDALEVNAGDAKVGMPELALDYDERDALVRHLDRVGVPKLVRREPPSDAPGGSRIVQLLARGRGFPMPTGGRSVDHAKQRADRELTADLEPWIELVP